MDAEQQPWVRAITALGAVSVVVGSILVWIGVAGQHRYLQLVGVIAALAGLVVLSVAHVVTGGPLWHRQILRVLIWPAAIAAAYYVLYWHVHEGQYACGWGAIDAGGQAALAGAVVAVVWGFLLVFAER